MTPEQRKMWDEQVAKARSTDYRYVCHWQIPHEILVAVDADLADLTRERDEARQEALRWQRKFELAAEQNYCTICGNTLDGYEGDKTRQRAEVAEAALDEAREEITRLETTLDTSRERLRDGLHRLRGSAPAEDDNG